MSRVDESWQRLGRLPALPIVCSFYALALLATLLLEKPAAMGVTVALLVALGLYCFARAKGGWAVFNRLGMPGAAATLLHFVGTPRWIGVFFMPVALFVVWQEDRRTLACSAGGAHQDVSPENS